jgi:hypothetical protein
MAASGPQNGTPRAAVCQSVRLHTSLIASAVDLGATTRLFRLTAYKTSLWRIIVTRRFEAPRRVCRPPLKGAWGSAGAQMSPSDNADMTEYSPIDKDLKADTPDAKG